MADKDERDIQEITFFGRQDSDTALDGVAKGDFLYALNIVNNSSGIGGKGVIKTIKGNLIIPFPLPSGYNKCIGTAEDHENNKFYMFHFNDQDHHAIYRFDGTTRQVTSILENITDTGGVNILNFSKDYIIMHADVIMNDLLYWVDGLNNARKTNIKKLLDNSSTGYGDVILQSYIDAYKKTASYAPVAAYSSDTTKKFNRLYGALRKFAVRYIYDDGEKSNWSDFSNVPIPSFEPFEGISVIPTQNNCIEVLFGTGDRTVVKIEIGMQSSSGAANDSTIFQWVSITTIDKKKVGVADNSQYVYKFYNETTYAAVATEKLIRPYSFLPKQPTCQSIVKNALVYTGGKEGFPVVDIDVDAAISYEPLFLGDETSNEFNEPIFEVNNLSSDYVEGSQLMTTYDGKPYRLKVFESRRVARKKITIGQDVKKGNKFTLQLTNGKSEDTFKFEVTASNTDSAVTIANKFKELLVATGRIYRKSPELPDSNIYDNEIVSGDVSFYFIISPLKDGSTYINGTGSVPPVQVDTLKNGGKSISNEKMGGSKKYGIVYHDDPDEKKSLAYTDDSLIITYDTINDQGGLKVMTLTLTVNHKPPIWAKYWSVVRSADLTYGPGYIQMLIQNVVSVNEDEAQDYLDLVVGSLFTFQKIHPNSPLGYDFKKGDVLKLIKKVDSDEYYPNFETEIISYNPVVTDLIRDNLTTTGSNTITVTEAKASNIGKFIVVDGVEREIVDAPVGGTTYLLNNVIGDSTAKTYLSYQLVDTRGTIRIRKPTDLTIANNSTVEIYSPASLSNPLGAKEFFFFQQQFDIINAGTENACHAGNIQNQGASTPAIVKISSGTTYVHNREMPVNNIFPGAQIVIQPVEDDDYSDFYVSNLNDNGRVTAEDEGLGQVSFPNRMRHSNNFIEDTRINGLNDFDNLDREDYYDDFGIIRRTVADKNNILVFKTLHTGYVPINARITIDDSGNTLRAGTAKLLNPMQYFSYEGGVGDNPEAYCSNGTHKYTLYPQAGVIIRIGANGEEPISKTFKLDKEVRDLLTRAVSNKAKIFMGFNQKLSLLIVTIEGFVENIYFDGLSSWIVISDPAPNDTVYAITVAPTHGTAVLASGQITYTPNTDYIGPDSVTYTATFGGTTYTKKLCLTYVDTPSETAWRPKESSYVCSLNESGQRNGMKGWNILEEYKLFDESLTGNEKPNDPSDPDYAAPIYDPGVCTIEESVGNDERSAFFRKDDCGSGMTGTLVKFTIAANTYTAPTKAEANADAEAALAAGGQAYANDPANGGICLANDTNTIIVADFKYDANLDICGYIDTPGVAESLNIFARNGLNFYPLATPARECYGLASDNMTDVNVKRRIQFNVEKLLIQYPLIDDFIFKVRGRSNTAGTRELSYSLKYPSQMMDIINSPGTYIPRVIPSGGPAPIGVTRSVTGGGDGTVGIGVGSVIVTFTYNRGTNAITVT